MRTIVFDLAISADEYQKYYRGTATEVTARSLDGRVIRFPANRLIPFVLHDGIRGRFQIRFDDNNRFVDMSRLW